MMVMIVMGNQDEEDLEYNQDIDKDALPDVVLIMVKIILMVKVMIVFGRRQQLKQLLIPSSEC